MTQSEEGEEGGEGEEEGEEEPVVAVDIKSGPVREIEERVITEKGNQDSVRHP